ncbi:helix-turn-helix transcriptional regulator [Methylomonas sp. 2BW1-5-20]|uniref:helix-turn-helix transcriptional regulator n=1 Tax=Methylomonas sp. 2BW1-5-20 TaxID=3376686 RepID=UPI00404ED249
MDRTADSSHLRSILAKAPGNSLIWKQFLVELIRQLNCDSSALLVTDPVNGDKTHFLFTAQIPKEYQELYETKLSGLDLFNSFISKNSWRAFYNQSLGDEYVEDNNKGFIPVCDQTHRFGISIPCNHKHAISLLLNRNKAFTKIEQQQIVSVLENIVEPMDEAIHAEQRHKIHSQLTHYIDGHFDGYIIVDHKLNIISSDPVFISIIGQLDCVKISQDRFGMKALAIEQRLLSLIQSNQGAASIHSHCNSCQITLIPMSYLKNLYQWECYKDGFILTFTHEKEKNPAIKRLIEIYHLSRCEAICALHFVQTPSISDIASNTYRSQETVRNHIKHTMQKMDAHSQAELMKKLITLTAL